MRISQSERRELEKNGGKIKLRMIYHYLFIKGVPTMMLYIILNE